VADLKKRPAAPFAEVKQDSSLSLGAARLYQCTPPLAASSTRFLWFFQKTMEPNERKKNVWQGEVEAVLI